jgi:hypothetical protein
MIVRPAAWVLIAEGDLDGCRETSGHRVDSVARLTGGSSVLLWRYVPTGCSLEKMAS